MPSVCPRCARETVFQSIGGRWWECAVCLWVVLTDIGREAFARWGLPINIKKGVSG